ncbi:MAG: hypothetical protein ACYC9L_07500 [Sulfuricaulis sp.]
MSRSRRKTPIYGHTTACSEARDKQQWHQRWRTHERDRLRKLTVDGEHPTTMRNEVSSTWDMAKDGRHWFGWREQTRRAESANADWPPNERRKLCQRRLAKLRST